MAKDQLIILANLLCEFKQAKTNGVYTFTEQERRLIRLMQQWVLREAVKH